MTSFFIEILASPTASNKAISNLLKTTSLCAQKRHFVANFPTGGTTSSMWMTDKEV